MRKILMLAGMFFFANIAVAMEIDWQWKLSHKCSSNSPAITVIGIPLGTKFLEVEMKDYDAPRYEHGGGRISHDGKTQNITIPEGALKSYKGPCPPNFNSFGHDYGITVTAIGADDKTELGNANNKKTFSAEKVKN